LAVQRPPGLTGIASVNVAVEITSPASQWRVVSIIYQQFDQMAQRP
jgi:hypothetical protein